jgi:hypothetical protein
MNARIAPRWLACASLLLVVASTAFARPAHEAAGSRDRWAGARALLQSAQQAQGWRGAYETALQRPRDGGVWLAAMIVQRCAEAERVVTRYLEQVAAYQVGGSTLLDRHRAAHRLDELCTGFAQDAPDAEANVQRLLASPEAKLDPLLALQRRYRDALQRGDAAATDAALADALALGSSLFFERLEAGATPRGRVFEGRLYADDAQRRGALYDAALFLAVCDAWNDCPQQGDYVLLRGCVERALCAQFREDYVPLVLGSAGDARELHALTDRIYDALRRGAVERFR